MSAGALFLMLGTWIAVTALTVFCFMKILQHRGKNS